MKRKLFSAILFGALLTASTSGLTSCKDYDDDISNLQSQIDKLATADQLSAKVSELQAAIASAQSAAEAKAAAAQSVADAASKAADAAAAAAKAAQSTADAATKDAAAAAAAAAEVQKAADKAIADLEAKAATKAELEAAAAAAQTYVDSVKKAIEETHAADKAAIETAIADGLDEVKAEIAKTNEELGKLAARLDVCEQKLAALEAGEGQEEVLAAIQEEVEAVADVLESLGVTVSEMITAVHLYPGIDGFNNSLQFWQVKEAVDRVFPTDIDDVENVTDETIKFEKGTVRALEDSILVRVSPANAVLHAEDIALLNTQGKEFDASLFEEIKVSEYTRSAPLTKADGNLNTGLWVVKFQLKPDFDADKFSENALYKKAKIAFALAVKNCDENLSEDRRVVTEYDVTAEAPLATHATTFSLTPDGEATKGVADVHHRFDNYTNKLAGTFPTALKGNDYRWSKAYTSEDDIKAGKVNLDFITDGDKPTAVKETSRQEKPVLTVKEKQDIVIEFNTDIKGFYVTLDYKRAGESGRTELNAWNSYSYENVAKIDEDGKIYKGENAKMQYGKKGYIKVNSLEQNSTLGDVIGFRVWAVNLDGSMVDPDGTAFYVGIGANAEYDEPVVSGSALVTTISPSGDANAVTLDVASAFNIDFNKIVWENVTANEDQTKAADNKAPASGDGYTPYAGTYELVAGSDPTKVDGDEMDLGLTSGDGVVPTTDIKLSYLNKNGSVITVRDGINFGKTSDDGDFTGVKKIKVVINNPEKLVDGKTYDIVGTMIAKLGSTEQVVRKIHLKVTKEMPSTSNPAFALQFRDYQDGVQVPDGSAIASNFRLGSWESWGAWTASSSETAKPHITNPKSGQLVMDNIYKFANNVNIKDAAAKFNASSITMKIKGAALGDRTNGARDVSTDSRSTWTATIAGQFINGSTYPVVAEITWDKISHAIDAETGKWNCKTPMRAEDSNSRLDNQFYKSVTAGADFTIKSQAPEGVTLTPWSKVGDGFLGYGWNSIRVQQKKEAPNPQPEVWTENNEVKWGVCEGTGKVIDLTNLNLTFGPKLVNVTKFATFAEAANVDSQGDRYLTTGLKNGKTTWSPLENGNVWVESEAGAESDYFTATIVGGHQKITLKQIRPSASENIKIFLCFEVVDCFDHHEIYKLPIKVVSEYTYSTAYQTTGSTTKSVGNGFLFQTADGNYNK